MEWKKLNLDDNCVIYRIIQDKHYLTYGNFYKSIKHLQN